MSDNIYGIWQDEEGYVWVADEAGFTRINGLEIKPYYAIEGKIFSGGRPWIQQIPGGFKFSSKNFQGTFIDGRYQLKDSDQDHGSQFQNYIQSYIVRGDTLPAHAGVGFPVRNNKLNVLFRGSQRDSLVIYNNKGEAIGSEDLNYYRENTYINLDTLKAVNPNAFVEGRVHRFFFISPVLADHENVYLVKKDGDVLEVNEDLNTKSLSFHWIKNIRQIIKNSTGNYYVLALHSDVVFHLNAEGEVLEELKVPDYKFQTDLVLGESLYAKDNLTSKIYKLNEGVFEEIVEGNHMPDPIILASEKIFYLDKYRGVQGLYMWDDGMKSKLVEFDKRVFGPNNVLIDSEENIWVLFSKSVYKISRAPLDVYTYNINSKPSAPNHYGSFHSLMRGEKALKFHSPTYYKTILYQVEGDKVDSLVLPYKADFCSLIDENTALITYFSSIHERGVAKVGLQYPFKVESLYSNFGGFVHANSTHVTVGDTLFEYSEDGLTNKIEFEGKPWLVRSNNNDDCIISVKSNLNKGIAGALPDVRVTYYLIQEGQKPTPIKKTDHIVNHVLLSDNKAVFFDVNTISSYNFSGDRILEKDIQSSDIPKPSSESFQIDENHYVYLSAGRFLLLSLDELKTSSLTSRFEQQIIDIDAFTYNPDFDKLYFITANKVYYVTKEELLGDSKINLHYLVKVPGRRTKMSTDKLRIEETDDQIVIYRNAAVYVYQKNFNSPISSFNTSLSSISSYSAQRELINSYSGEQDGLRLNYLENNLSFKFNTISNYKPEALHYEYKLIGAGIEEWLQASSDSIFFTNLSSGAYEFVFKAVNDEGVESSEIFFKFKVKPPWYASWWAILAYVVISVSGVYIYVKQSQARLLKKQAELESEISKATEEIREQKDEIEFQHQEIKDSMEYAKRIQSAILPPLKLVREYLHESFILYKPKDIVAGDFYWMEPMKERVLFAAADCTGHGIPGAMVSVVCNGALNRSVREFGLTEPGEILTKAREIVVEEFEKSEEEVKDGMDIALCSLEGNTLKYAGAHNPLWIVRKGAEQIEEVKADKQPVGKFDHPTPFTTHTVTLNEGDAFYVFSDGFADQFGGEKGKKFKTANFKRLLLSLQSEPIEEQVKAINRVFEEWKGTLEQLDDVCVIGVRM